MNFTEIKALIFSFALCAAAASNAAEPNYDDLIQESLVLRNNGDFTQAETTLRQALPLAAETNEVAFLLAMVIAFQERFIESITILDAALQTYPDDTQLLLGKARVLSYQGFYGESIKMTDQVLTQDASNIEALSLKARVFYYQRRYADARAQFNAVLAVDPTNLEALIGLYDVQVAAGNDADAGAVLDRAEAISPAHIDVTTRRQQRSLPLAKSAHFITTGYAQSNLDLPAYQNWQSSNLEYRFRSESNRQFYLRSEHAHRFGLHDSLLEVGSILSRTNSSLEFSIAHTSDNTILPKRRVRLGGSMLLMQANENFGSTIIGAAFTQSNYGDAAVDWLQVDLTHYLLNANAWLTPGIGLVKDELGKKTFGWNIGVHWQASARLLFGYNYTDAPETELSVTTQTNVHHTYFRVGISDNSTLRLDLSRNTRQNSYVQDTVALSYQHQF